MTPRCRLTVRVSPRASHTEVSGMRGEALQIKLTAPPLAGKANQALIAFLADRLELPKDAISIVRGWRSREKVVEVIGFTEGEVRQRLLPQESRIRSSLTP